MSARSLNKVQLIGNLTRDPVLTYTPKNTAICKFGLATGRTFQSDGGERREETDFHNIVIWSRLGEVAAQYLKKGAKVYLEGRIQTRKWQDQEGKDHYMTEIVVQDMIMLGGRNDAGSGTSSSGGGSYSDASPDMSNQAPTEDVSEAAASGRSNVGKRKKAAVPETVSDDVTNVQDIADDIPF